MHIEFDKINEDKFNVSEREHPVLGKVVLICPKKTKHEWEDEELHLRSLLCRDNGEVICSSLPKFFNYGERPDLDIITREGIISGKAMFPEKMDGSLIIRSVVNNYVSFRTRGHQSLGEFEEAVMPLIKTEYPELLNKDFYNEVSMVFEFTSPDNKIILSYDKPELTILGIIEHAKDNSPLFYSSEDFVNKISESTGVRTPRFYSLPNDPKLLTEHVAAWKDAEGVVIWIPLENGKMHLAKIKADDYIRLHGIRYHLSAERIRKIIHASNVQTEQQLKDIFFNLGLDWESAKFTLPVFEEHMAQQTYVRNKVLELTDMIDARGIKLYENRKDIVMELKEICKDSDKRLFGIGMNYALEEKERFERNVIAWQLGIAQNSLSNWEQSANEIIHMLMERKQESEDN